MFNFFAAYEPRLYIHGNYLVGPNLIPIWSQDGDMACLWIQTIESASSSHNIDRDIFHKREMVLTSTNTHQLQASKSSLNGDVEISP